MHWIAREDRTLALSQATPTDRQAAFAALEGLQSCGTEAGEHLGTHLSKGVRGGVVQARTLVGLGRICHAHEADRAAARAASTELFGFVLPTPTAGLANDYFWRVARRLEHGEGPTQPAQAQDTVPSRSMTFRTFSKRIDACAYATELGDRLVSITETQGAGSTTLWFWTG